MVEYDSMSVEELRLASDELNRALEAKTKAELRSNEPKVHVTSHDRSEDTGHELGNLNQISRGPTPQGAFTHHWAPIQKLTVAWILVGLWIFLGAYILHATEYDRELNTARETEFNYNGALKLLTASEQAAVTELFKQRFETSGLCSWPNEAELNWTWDGAMFYCMTIVTTIGYGLFAPATEGGQIFTIIFAIFGIMFYGVANGYLAAEFETLLYYSIKRIRGKPSPEFTLFIVSLAITLYLVFMGWFYSEDPGIGDFSTGVWFSFVTCSTIGFGDYGPTAGGEGKMYSPMNYVWVFCGCALMGLGLGSLSNWQARQQQKLAHMAGLANYITLDGANPVDGYSEEEVKRAWDDLVAEAEGAEGFECNNEQFEIALKKLDEGWGCGGMSAEEVFAEIDTEDDGTVSFDQFAKLCLIDDDGEAKQGRMKLLRTFILFTVLILWTIFGAAVLIATETDTEKASLADYRETSEVLCSSLRNSVASQAKLANLTAHDVTNPDTICTDVFLKESHTCYGTCVAHYTANTLGKRRLEGEFATPDTRLRQLREMRPKNPKARRAAEKARRVMEPHFTGSTYAHLRLTPPPAGALDWVEQYHEQIEARRFLTTCESGATTDSGRTLPFSDSEGAIDWIFETFDGICSPPTVDECVNTDSGWDCPVQTWTWSKAILFCFTIYTTIGYGNFCVETDVGKIFTVIYALLGFGVFGMTLQSFSVMVLDKIITPMLKCCCKSKDKDHVDKHKYLKLVGAATVLVLGAGSVVYRLFWEHWTGEGITFLQAFYFTFISSTTIGLGDYSPANYNYQSILFTLPFLLVCLAIFALFLAIGSSNLEASDEDNQAEDAATALKTSAAAKSEAEGNVETDASTDVSAANDSKVMV